VFNPFKKRIKKEIWIVSAFLSVSLTFVVFIFLITIETEDEIPEYFLEDRLVPKTRDCASADLVEYFYYTKPKNSKNNKFGLYIYAEQKEFMELAQNLVNSNGGDWGYVLIPYNVKDYDYDKWKGVFDRLYSKHLIPIIQLWDINPDDYKGQTSDAAEFLDRFAWPVKQRYISVYNEPNDAKFWDGEVDAAGYARVLDYTIATFKKQNSGFLIFNGALNTSAPTDYSHMDAFNYMYLMNEEVPGIFEKLDGWASHSYPQPNFSGRPKDFGRWSIRAYENELDFLKETLNVEKDLPVFITETGWAHAEGEYYNESYLSVDEISDYFEYAYEEVWLPDERVMAVTPFTIWYEPPFDHFSWVNSDNVPYEHYNVIKSMKKVSGTPSHLVVGQIEIAGCE
jgi:hypothetical protein